MLAPVGLGWARTILGRIIAAETGWAGQWDDGPTSSRSGGACPIGISGQSGPVALSGTDEVGGGELKRAGGVSFEECVVVSAARVSDVSRWQGARERFNSGMEWVFDS
jgi:hypothetical protein